MRCWRLRAWSRALVCVGILIGFTIDITAVAATGDLSDAKRELPAVRLEAPPTIDGDLSDPAWQKAARADRFTDALLGNVVADQTVALLAYDASWIYVAFYAYDRDPGGIVARETKRGSPLRGEDTVALYLDSFHSHRDRSVFRVNPLGTQFARFAGGRSVKLEWEGAWKAAARVVADGWTAEIAIPWSILNYPAVKAPRPASRAPACGLNFERHQERAKISSWWSNLGAEGAERDGHWTGVVYPPFRPQLSLLPYAAPGWLAKEGAGVRSGLDLRARLTPTLTLVGTVNPDFENLEGAVEGIDFSYGERFVPDRRPFFQEAPGGVQTLGQVGIYFHSRRIGPFDAGINLGGKPTDRDTIQLLAALDLGRRAD